jgi:uncharacterized FlgJ-related protein
MLYTYCKKSLMFNRIKPSKIIKLFFIAIAIFTSAIYLTYDYAKYRALEQSIDEMHFEEQVIIVNQRINNDFSKEALVEELKRLNVKYPHIVMAQAMIESGHFQSNIFRSNHNLFGMKEARQRVTTARGTNLNHAYYENWKESVIDYAMFQASYLKDLKTEAAYLEYLDKNYAEAQKYDIAVQNMVKNENLKELFN